MAAERLKGVGIGNEEVVAGRAGPGGIDLDGVSDDSNDGDTTALFVEEPVDHVGIKRVGVDDEIGLEVIEQGGDGILGLCDEGQRFGEILSISGTIHPGPDAGGVGCDFAIGAAENPVDDGVSKVTRIGDFYCCLTLKGFREVTGGTVMAVSEAGGEDQDLRLHVKVAGKRCKGDPELRRLPFRGSLSLRTEMAKNDKNDRSEEIRVVGDSEEEVVRLDAPRRAPLERKEAASEDRAMPHMMGDAREVEEAKAEAVDPENEWLEEAAKKEGNALPFGWFVLLGITIAGVMFWAISQNAASSETGESGGGASLSADGETDLPLGRMEELDAIEKAEAHYEAMEGVVTGFFAAGTPEERARYVRDVDRVLPLMKDFYQRNQIETHQFKETLEYHVVSLENYAFIALKVGFEDGDPKPLLLEDSPEGLKVDWESYVCYQPVDIDRFSQERMVEPVEVRAYVKRDLFYAYDFADESKFACYQLTFRDSDVELFGYVERGTKLDREFRKLFPEGASGGLKNPLILSVSFVPGSRAPRSVKINDLLSRLWAYPSGSRDEAAKSENE